METSEARDSQKKKGGFPRGGVEKNFPLAMNHDEQGGKEETQITEDSYDQKIG